MLTATLEGSPFERGYQHGRQFANEIREVIQAYCQGSWLAAPEVKTLEKRLLESMSTQFPELVVEMVGISKGSEVDFDQITLLNLVLATDDLESNAVSKAFKLTCSAIGFMDSEVGCIVGKNCDEALRAAPFYLFETIRPDRGREYMCISWVGTVWAEAGLNKAGLALMQTAGPMAPDQDGHGIVCNIAPRPVLERCSTAQEAVEMFARMDVAGWGMGMVIGDASGTLIALEKTYNKHAIRRPQDGVVFCTNHFVEPTMKGTLPFSHQGILPNSEARYLTLTTLFAEQGWPHTLEGMKSALGYHGEAGFVCQHGDANVHTNYSCIAVPTRRQVHLGRGYPCRGQYTVYQL